ncbi:MAG: hypothetical protein JWO41_3 [Candidatus Saccharibacteria bacterium]|nr:hypothetical protein [Candidatus Saccharibacteria bacterium]
MSEIAPSTPVTDPTVIAAHERLQASMADILPLFELDAETGAAAFHDYITQKSTELAVEDGGKTISAGSGGTDTFIGPETNLLIGTMYRDFRMDDPKAYEASLSFIKQQFNDLKDKMPHDRAYMNAVIAGATVGQVDYFGSVGGSAEKMAKISADLISEDVAPYVSISEYGQAAMCNQRSAVVHNTLHLFGVGSRLELGNLGTINPDGSVTQEQHAFLTIQNSKGQRVIFDPTNPIAYRNEEGVATWVKPALYPVKLDEEGRQRVALDEIIVAGGKHERRTAHELVYTLDTDINAA